MLMPDTIETSLMLYLFLIIIYEQFADIVSVGCRKVVRCLRYR
jgi:hypothetical protein